MRRKLVDAGPKAWHEKASGDRQGAEGGSPLQRRFSRPHWPRVMRRRPARAWRSVDRGARRPAIEPRKRLVQGADVVHAAEGNTAGCAKRVPGRPCVVEDTGMRVRSLPGNREISGPTGGLMVSLSNHAVGPHREGEEP